MILKPQKFVMSASFVLIRGVDDATNGKRHPPICGRWTDGSLVRSNHD
jgi:hypothetical protein